MANQTVYFVVAREIPYSESDLMNSYLVIPYSSSFTRETFNVKQSSVQRDKFLHYALVFALAGNSQLFSAKECKIFLWFTNVRFQSHSSSSPDN